jgi:hypothetical protein
MMYLTDRGQPNGIDRFTLLESGTYQLKVLTDNGIVFCATWQIKKTEDFRTNLLKAIKYGFDKTKH